MAPKPAELDPSAPGEAQVSKSSCVSAARRCLLPFVFNCGELGAASVFVL